MNKSILLPVVLLCLLAPACVKKSSDTTGKDAKARLEQWMDKYYPGIQPNADGLYILEDEPGAGDPHEAENFPFIKLRGTVRLLTGAVSTSTEEEMAKQLGTFQHVNYYGPLYHYLAKDYSYAGLDALVKGDGNALPPMRIGGRRKAVIPSWMLTTSRYSTQAGYIDACSSSTHLIYDITLMGQSADAEADGLRRISDYIGFNYPGTESCSYSEDVEPDGSFFFISDTSGFDEEDKLSNEASIQINYTGKLLDGKVFDTTIRNIAVDARIDSDSKTYEPQSVTYSSTYSDVTMGDSSSLINGFKGAISLMHWKGQKAIAIFACGHGYGASGSSNSSGTVIPPYEPLIFEIEILADE